MSCTSTKNKWQEERPRRKSRNANNNKENWKNPWKNRQERRERRITGIRGQDSCVAE
jgi:hypothetical protein